MVKKKYKGYFKKTTQVLSDAEVKKVNKMYNLFFLEMKKEV